MESDKTTSKELGLLTLGQFVETYKWPKNSERLRHLYRQRKRLGLDNCFFRVGKILLVDPRVFFETIRKKKADNGLPGKRSDQSDY